MIARIFFINQQGEFNSVEVGCKDYRSWLCNLEDFYNPIYKSIKSIEKVEFIEGNIELPSLNITFRINEEGWLDSVNDEFLSIKPRSLWFTFASRGVEDDYDEELFILVCITSKGVYYTKKEVDEYEKRKMLSNNLNLIQLIKDCYLPFQDKDLYQLPFNDPKEVVNYILQS